jgi:hypothetical protein
MMPGYWEHRSKLHPAGDKTIQVMTDKGWIETREDDRGKTQYRITPAGVQARSLSAPPKKRKPPRLKMLGPMIKTRI